MKYNLQRLELIDLPKSSSIYTRVEPELKEQAEKVLSRLGMPMANAINLFLHQVVLQDGIPFDVKPPKSKPLAHNMLSKEQFDVEVEKGIADLKAGRIVSSKQASDISTNPHKNVPTKVRNIGFLKGPSLPDSFFDPLPEEDLELWGL